MDTETLEQMLARHRKELKDLQGRITNKKKNASKKTRKGVNDECADMERQLRDKQTVELALFPGHATQGLVEEDDDDADAGADAVETNNEQRPMQENKVVLPSDGLGGDPQGGGGGGGGGGGKKKKNRQKERLARRAAEQETAMQRAHDEASQMTDHRARESEYMKRMFEMHGLVEKDINPDGHCLFSAVADQLDQLSIPLDMTTAVAAVATAQDPAAYKMVRRAAAEYMVAHADDFAPFLEEEDLAAYASRMRDTAEWGGQLELTALARCFGVEIRVIQDGRTEKIGEEQGRRTLWLAYYRHGYGLGEHYNSLRKMTPTTAATTTTATTTTAAAAAAAAATAG